MDDKKIEETARVTLKGFDPENLYEKRVFTDPNAGDVLMLVPVLKEHPKYPGVISDGGPDHSRRPRFLSSITVSFRGMPRAINFEIEAVTLSEALAKWLETAERAGREFQEKAEAAWTRQQLVGGGSMPVREPKIVLN